MKEKNTLLKMIIHSKGSPREMTLSSPIYRQCQYKNASEKTPFHKQNMPEPFEEQSTDPSNRGANKDNQTNLIPIPSINHPTSFPINYKNDLNIMVERDGSIVCLQNSKEHETKKQNHNHQTNNLLGSKETDKNNRKQYPENKILQFEQKLQQRNTKLENSKGRPLQDQIITKKKKKVIIIGDSMIKKIDGYLLTSSINHKYLVKVRPFLGAKSVDMLDYVKPIKRDLDPEAYVIHIGTNDLGIDKTPDDIFSEILLLIKELKTDKNKIVVSAIVPRGDAIIQKLKK